MVAHSRVPAVNALGLRTLVDFTDGTHIAGDAASPGSADVMYDAGFSANFTNGRSYNLSSRGLCIRVQDFIDTARYAAWKWEPGTLIDLSEAGNLYIEIEAPWGNKNSPYGAQVVNGLSVFMVEQSGGTYTNYCNKSWGIGGTKTSELMLVGGPLWNWTKSATPPVGFPHAMMGLRKIEMRFTAHSSGLYPAEIYIRRLLVGRPRCILLLSFDDGWDSQYNIVFPMFQSAGIVGTLFPQTSIFGVANKLTDAMAQEMAAAGWGIGHHGEDHTVDPLVSRFAATTGLTRSGTTATCTTTLAHYLTTGDYITMRGLEDPKWNRVWGPVTVTSSTQFTFVCNGDEVSGPVALGSFDRRDNLDRLEEIIAASREYFNNLGIYKGTRDSWAYMNGNYNMEVVAKMRAQGIMLARTTAVGATSQVAAVANPDINSNAWLSIPTRGIDQQTASQCFSWLDQAEAIGGLISMYGHRSVDNRSPASGEHDYLELQKFIVDGEGANASVKRRVQEGRIDVYSYPGFIERCRQGGRYFPLGY